MRKDTYRIGDGTFAFSPAVFDSLLGHGAKGAARMRELAGAMHVSISSIKDWRRGTTLRATSRRSRISPAGRTSTSPTSS